MPGYTLRDPRPAAQENPYTFFLPSAQEIAEIAPGLLVKLTFAADPPDREYDAERMWVRVTKRDGETLTGLLENDPRDIPGLTAGEEVKFKTYHILAVLWEDAGQKARLVNGAVDQDRFFERCFVDDAVIEGRARVQYLYREPPETAPEDHHPDSGWRIRADVDALSDEEYENTPASYLAIGVVLNQDDSILPLIESPAGSAFLRGEDSQFHPTKYTGAPLKNGDDT